MRNSTHKKLKAEKAALRWRISVHEAGHCVAKELLCGGVAFAEVSFSDGQNATLGKTPEGGPEATADDIEHSCISAVSGAVAEALVLGDVRGAAGDLPQLFDWLVAGGMAESAANEVLIDSGKEARKLIGAHLPAVKAIAEALLEKGRIEGAEVATIVAAQSAKSEEVSKTS
jgi:ATP-dependent Zn protease